MAAVTPTTQGNRHVVGDLIFRAYVVGTVNNADTMVVPQARIEVIDINAAATGADPTATYTSGPGDATSTITFLSGSAWSGRVGVWSRLG